MLTLTLTLLALIAFVASRYLFLVPGMLLRFRYIHLDVGEFDDMTPFFGDRFRVAFDGRVRRRSGSASSPGSSTRSAITSATTTSRSTPSSPRTGCCPGR